MILRVASEQASANVVELCLICNSLSELSSVQINISSVNKRVFYGTLLSPAKRAAHPYP